MKFIIQLGFHYATETRSCVLPACLRSVPQQRGSRSLHRRDVAERQRAPDLARWTKYDGKYVCNDCGATIMAVHVAHPVHDGPFPGSGSGEVVTEEVGYCPNCEKKPSPYGAPITP